MKTTKRSRAATTQAQRMAQTLRRALFESMLRCADGASDQRGLTVEPAARPIAPALLAAAHPESVRQAMCALYETLPAALPQRRRWRPREGRRRARRRRPLRRRQHAGPAGHRRHALDAAAPARPARHGRAPVFQLGPRQPARAPALLREDGHRRGAGRPGLDPRDHQGPAAVEHVQRGARGYLRELLGLEPDGLTLSESGLGLAPAALGA